MVTTSHATGLEKTIYCGPQEGHADQGLNVGLYTPTILGGNSYLSWFYDRGAINDPAHTGTSKGLFQAINRFSIKKKEKKNRGPIRSFLPRYANVYVTIQSHGRIAGARSHYVAANWIRNGLNSLWTDASGPDPGVADRDKDKE